MFTVFSLNQSRPFSTEERIHLFRMLTECVFLEEFSWLNELPLYDVQFCWCDAMPERDIMGAFSPLRPHSIFLMPDSTENVTLKRPYWVEILFPSVIHELRHMWQFRTNPLRYLLCLTPVLRSITIEVDAEKQYRAAQAFAEKFSARWDAAEFRKNQQKREK